MTHPAVGRRVLLQMLGGVTVISVPIGVWWYQAQADREELRSKFRHRIQIPGSSDTYDYLIAEKCQPGDVILFDRRCERCAVSPWAAAACFASKQFGIYNHCGLIVPGYAKTKAEELDPINLLLLEATPSGIVARPLKDRLEQSTSHSILLLQVCSPGERRNDDEDPPPSVLRTHQYVHRELSKFRDQWIAAGEKQGYRHFHSTVTMGGALAYTIGAQSLIAGPVSPAAFLVLTGLQKAAVAMNTNEAENRTVLVSGFLRDYRKTDQNVVRLRPGYRFLPPITLKQGNLDD